jgi:hypothetical protein
MKKLLAIPLLVAVVWGIVVPADAMTEQHEVLLGQRVEAHEGVALSRIILLLLIESKPSGANCARWRHRQVDPLRHTILGQPSLKRRPAAPQTSSVAARVVRVSIDQTVFTVKTDANRQERLLKSAAPCNIYRDDQVMLHNEDGGAIRMATPSVVCYVRETGNP